MKNNILKEELKNKPKQRNSDWKVSLPFQFALLRQT